jgi:hypothetical protein
VLQQRLTLPLVAHPTSSATAARDLTIIATADGGYASASDIEDENIIAANI